MQAPDYYQILGLSRDASQEDIKKSYRKLALKYHPDRNQGDPESEKRFKEVSEAYSILSDEEKKSQYDRFGTVGEGAGFSGDIFESFSEMFQGFGFGDMFGGRRGSGRRQQRGTDISMQINITLQDVLRGVSRKVQVKRNIVCEKCDGAGAKDPSSIKTCSQCGGKGEVAIQAGFMTVVRPCPVCEGTGTLIESPCDLCSGAGVRPEIKSIDLDIPPGVSHGTQMRVAGFGNFEKGCHSPGDAYLVVNIVDDRRFERNGPDLFTVKQIEIEHAILGGDIQVEGINGEKASLHIPAGMQTHTDFKINNMGLPVAVDSKQRGSLYVQIHIKTPQSLTEESIKILKDFEQSRKK
tara:strand:+ start:9238 stop:10290 length:1053 start_codon:yes stop_codon:yes gene_type:complete